MWCKQSPGHVVEFGEDSEKNQCGDPTISTHINVITQVGFITSIQTTRRYH